MNILNHGGHGAAHGHVTDVVGRLRAVRRSAASRPGWLRQRRVGGAGGKARAKEVLGLIALHCLMIRRGQNRQHTFTNRSSSKPQFAFPFFCFSSVSSVVPGFSVVESEQWRY